MRLNIGEKVLFKLNTGVGDSRLYIDKLHYKGFGTIESIDSGHYKVVFPNLDFNWFREDELRYAVKYLEI